MKIAVDFDGTIVENKFPDIGKPMLFGIETLHELQKRRHQLILWTFRAGHHLEEAVKYCEEQGITFYAVNHSYPEEVHEFERHPLRYSRKIDADIFIDDRNVGGFPGWSKIFRMIHPEEGDTGLVDAAAHHNYKRKSFWKRLFGK